MTDRLCLQAAAHIQISNRSKLQMHLKSFFHFCQIRQSLILSDDRRYIYFLDLIRSGLSRACVLSLCFILFILLLGARRRGKSNGNSDIYYENNWIVPKTLAEADASSKNWVFLELMSNAISVAASLYSALTALLITMCLFSITGFTKDNNFWWNASCVVEYFFEIVWIIF